MFSRDPWSHDRHTMTGNRVAFSRKRNQQTNIETSSPVAIRSDTTTAGMINAGEAIAVVMNSMVIRPVDVESSPPVASC
jgi:hypothetical protein